MEEKYNFFSGAMGLFFGSIFAIAAADEVGKLIRRDGAAINQTSRVLMKYIASIPVTIPAFPAGAISGTLMMFNEELSNMQIIARAALISLPFILLSLILVYFLQKSTSAPIIQDTMYAMVQHLSGTSKTFLKSMSPGKI